MASVFFRHPDRKRCRCPRPGKLGCPGGAWEYRIDLGVDPSTGKRRQKGKAGFSTKREATAAAALLQVQPLPAPWPVLDVAPPPVRQCVALVADPFGDRRQCGLTGPEDVEGLPLCHIHSRRLERGISTRATRELAEWQREAEREVAEAERRLAELNVDLAKAEARWRQVQEFLGTRRAIDAETRLIVMRRCKYRCTYCKRRGGKKRGPDGRPWHIDHVVAVVADGGDNDENLTLACATCNERKQDRFLLYPGMFAARQAPTKNGAQPKPGDPGPVAETPGLSRALHT